MDISRDKEFRRAKDAARQPARKTESDVRAGEVRGPDFDLRRARDAPVQEDNRYKGRNLYQGASEDGAVPAADSSVDSAASRQSSGGSDSFIQDSRGDPQQSGPDFSGRDSFRESRQQDSGHSDSGRFQRRDADFSRRGGQELSGFGNSEAGSTNAGETPGRRRTHQHGNKYQQRSRRRQKPRNPRRNSRGQPKENRNGLPSWNLPLTSCHRRRRIKS